MKKNKKETGFFIDKILNITLVFISVSFYNLRKKESFYIQIAVVVLRFLSKLPQKL